MTEYIYIYIMFYENLRIDMPWDFSCCLLFFTIFGFGKKNSPYFPFHNVGRSAIYIYIYVYGVYIHIAEISNGSHMVHSFFSFLSASPLFWTGMFSWFCELGSLYPKLDLFPPLALPMNAFSSSPCIAIVSESPPTSSSPLKTSFYSRGLCTGPHLNSH